MKTETVQQQLCCLMKEETLATYESKDNLNELILENEPFPGYYSQGNNPEHSVPTYLKSVFLPVNPLGMCHTQEMMKITYRVMERMKTRIPPCPSVIGLNNFQHHAIRVKFYDIDRLPEIIGEYKKHEVIFLKRKKTEMFRTMIHLYKFIGFERLEDGIYSDSGNNNIDYVRLKKLTDWEGFKNLVLSIRNNSNLPIFDAALCSVLTHQGELQFMRVYKEKGYKISDLIQLSEKANSDLLFAH